ncbi:nucleoside-diphosphate-sugar epimerase [Rubricella aquisinus]|uniref:Nucleoside-diphosphate-sugar epimerase n=1 Tax=Rubricella aquisinus TaxID=2028108 RepID=A0A840WX37_9RHOB|nr:NAD-dependent epimerase/dehydratase family protein [Rubricella aquisinus]MBB5514256.1 nucleoside-diphosphate-sugar epimerase [Rubricella aquisinus]
MTKTVLILGATGRFGKHSADAFRTAGWRVETLRRPGGTSGTRAGDPMAPDGLIAAAQGVDVIVNALNPAYPDWSRDLPRITRSVIAAAQSCGARVIIPGNIYPYGTRMPRLLQTTTPHVAQTKKGRLRIEMENAYRRAHVPTLILRAGDFIDTEASGNWLESHMLKPLGKGAIMYPGPLDRPHAWAYLPDVARAAVALIEQGSLPDFADIPFQGYTLTGQDLLAAISESAGQSLRVTPMRWGAVKLVSLFSPLMREVLEMRYLWEVPHGLDPAPLTALLPDFECTPLQVALRSLIAQPGQSISTQTSR